MKGVARARDVQEERRATNRSGLEFALLAAVTSGVAVFVNGEAVGRFSSPTVYTTGKNLVAGLVLVGIAAVAARFDRDHGAGRKDRAGDVVRPSRPTELFGLVTVAVIGGAVPFVLFFEGLARATSRDAAFIHKTLVVWVAVLAVVFLREKITAVHVASVVVLVVAQIALADGIGTLRPGVGETMILAATLCWAAELIVVKRLLESVRSTVVAACRIAGGAVLLVMWLSATGRLQSITELSTAQWAWLALTGAVLSLFVSIWFAAVARAQVVDVAAVLVLGSVITGVIDVSTGGAVAMSRIVGWLLITLATGALVTRWAAETRRRVVA